MSHGKIQRRVFPLAAGFSSLRQMMCPHFKFEVFHLVKIKKSIKRSLTWNYSGDCFVLFCGTKNGNIVAGKIIIDNENNIKFSLLTIIIAHNTKIKKIIDCSDYLYSQSIAVVSKDGDFSIISVIDQLVVYNKENFFTSDCISIAELPTNPFLFVGLSEPDIFEVCDTMTGQRIFRLSGFGSIVSSLSSHGAEIAVACVDGTITTLNINSDLPDCKMHSFAAFPGAKIDISPDMKIILIIYNKSWILSNGIYQIAENKEKYQEDITSFGFLDENTFYIVHKVCEIFSIKESVKTKITETMNSTKFIITHFKNGMQTKLETKQIKPNFNKVRVIVQKIKEMKAFPKMKIFKIDERFVVAKSDEISIISIIIDDIQNNLCISDSIKGTAISQYWFNNDLISLKMNGDLYVGANKIGNHQNSYLVLCAKNTIITIGNEIKKWFLTSKKEEYQSLRSKVIDYMVTDELIILISEKILTLLDFYSALLLAEIETPNKIIKVSMHKGFVAVTLETHRTIFYNPDGTVVSTLLSFQHSKNISKKYYQTTKIVAGGLISCAIWIPLDKIDEHEILSTHMWPLESIWNQKADPIICGDNNTLSIPLSDFDAYHFTPNVSAIMQIFERSSIHKIEEKRIKVSPDIDGNVECRQLLAMTSGVPPSPYALGLFANSDDLIIRADALSIIDASLYVIPCDEALEFYEMLNESFLDKFVFSEITLIFLDKFDVSIKHQSKSIIKCALESDVLMARLYDVFNKAVSNGMKPSAFFIESFDKNLSKKVLHYVLKLAYAYPSEFVDNALKHENYMKLIIQFVERCNNRKLIEFVVMAILSATDIDRKRILMTLCQIKSYTFSGNYFACFGLHNRNILKVSLETFNMDIINTNFCVEYISINTKESVIFISDGQNVQYFPVVEYLKPKIAKQKKLSDKFIKINDLQWIDETVVKIVFDNNKSIIYKD